jgi:hypothetical protein
MITEKLTSYENEIIGRHKGYLVAAQHPGDHFSDAGVTPQHLAVNLVVQLPANIEVYIEEQATELDTSRQRQRTSDCTRCSRTPVG